MINTATKSLIIASLVLSAAIFGFFYAWVCSTMLGLDISDPRVAIRAMQDVNASVRNAIFFPAFFVTPVMLCLTAVVLWVQGFKPSGVYFAISGIVYLLFGLVLTVVVHIPMNDALAAMTVPDDIATARAIWQDYSPDWQFWNVVRTCTSGLSFVIAVMGVLALVPTRNATVPA